jgi:hypothetical protein
MFGPALENAHGLAFYLKADAALLELLRQPGRSRHSIIMSDGDYNTRFNAELHQVHGAIKLVPIRRLNPIGAHEFVRQSFEAIRLIKVNRLLPLRILLNVDGRRWPGV